MTGGLLGRLVLWQFSVDYNSETVCSYCHQYLIDAEDRPLVAFNVAGLLDAIARHAAACTGADAPTNLAEDVRHRLEDAALREHPALVEGLRQARAGEVFEA